LGPRKKGQSLPDAGSVLCAIAAAQVSRKTIAIMDFVDNPARRTLLVLIEMIIWRLLLQLWHFL
jgi:hypothetical protein